MSVPRKTRKQLVGKRIENRETWERETEYQAWARDLHRQWQAITCQGATQLVTYFAPCTRFAKS
jgi:hypothetical protein